ncbi:MULTISPECIES: DUF1661 domain-containing protein [Porphyromonas]|uniref:DUF1661 domain-containing protein n=1 Tax=Porphyromonas TaxID=836 RepID=UPI001E52EED9|nr:DUF1661 domain-containing protein [Porphyromonas gulae]
MARKIFHSRTKTKKISRHVFHHHKPRFLRTIFVFLSPCRLRGQSLLARTSVCGLHPVAVSASLDRVDIR